MCTEDESHTVGFNPPKSFPSTTTFPSPLPPSSPVGFPPQSTHPAQQHLRPQLELQPRLCLAAAVELPQRTVTVTVTVTVRITVTIRRGVACAAVQGSGREAVASGEDNRRAWQAREKDAVLLGGIALGDEEEWESGSEWNPIHQVSSYTGMEKVKGKEKKSLPVPRSLLHLTLVSDHSTHSYARPRPCSSSPSSSASTHSPSHSPSADTPSWAACPPWPAPAPPSRASSASAGTAPRAA